jgi:hypothetical protein
MKTVVHRLPLTRAHINLGQVVRRVHVNREYLILEKDGIPVVGLMHVDDLEDYLEQQDGALKAQSKTAIGTTLRAELATWANSWRNCRRPSKKLKKKTAKQFTSPPTPASPPR